MKALTWYHLVVACFTVGSLSLTALLVWVMFLFCSCSPTRHYTVIDETAGVNYGSLDSRVIGMYIMPSDSVERRGDTVWIRGKR